jgi:hypothetical protein
MSGRWSRLLLLAAIVGCFVALAAPGAGERGIIAEEIQPYLARHSRVLERTSDGKIALMPPDEPNAPPRPRIVATSQWPVLSWDGATRQWPIFLRGHQTALGSYFGIALGPLLGGGVAGVRRSSIALAVIFLLLLFLVGKRLSREPLVPLLATALAATAFGFVWLGRSGYAFELASRVGMLGALAIAARSRADSSPWRAVAIGAATGIAILCRATIAITMLPALAILLAHPTRRMRGWKIALGLAIAIALPIGFLAIIEAIVPLRAGTGPLSGFPVGELLSRAAAIPRQLSLELAWVADANGILGPLTRGENAGGTLLPAAIAGALPLGIALARWWRGTASDAERMLVCGALADAIAGAWLYRAPNQFQLGLALEPLWALAVAEQVAALATRQRRGIAIALLFFLRVQGDLRGLLTDRNPGNPMLSGRTQRAAVARIAELGAEKIVTTDYQQAGVIEAWSHGTLRPLHAWPVLRSDGKPLDDAWRALLTDLRPRAILLSPGGNLFGSGPAEQAAIAASLSRVAAQLQVDLTVDRDFPTESGAPGWRLVYTVYTPTASGP